MKIKAKMQCNSVEKFATHEVVKMSAVYGGEKNSEDNTFASATPTATLEMSITNTAVFGAFEPGKKYYLDFRPEEIAP